MTIHNLAYQGQYGKDIMGELGLPWDLFTSHDGIEFYDTVNFLKAGIVFSDAVTTVSPTYAREIQTPELGANMDGLLRRQQGLPMFGSPTVAELEGDKYAGTDPRRTE
jgi:starch synthase